MVDRYLNTMRIKHAQLLEIDIITNLFFN